MIANNKLTIKLVKSLIGVQKSHKSIIFGLGLRRLNSITCLEDTPAIRGMINKVSYLVSIIK